MSILDWDKQQKVKEDINQTFLNPDLSLSRNKYILAKDEPKLKYNDIVLCPFCLTSNKLSEFLVRKGLRVCSKCGSQLKLSTLAKINNLDRFVKFVFDYRLNGFWDKICLDISATTKDSRFKEWNQRLFNLGISEIFWIKYKVLRGDNDNEDLEEE